MPNVEKMKAQLTAWNLLSQVWELKDAGYSLDEAITFVYYAYTRGFIPTSRFTA